MFGAATVGDVFQKTIDEVYSGIPKVLGIADDILLQAIMSRVKTKMKQEQVFWVC